MSVLGSKIKELRKAHKLTQEDFAKILRERFHLKTDRVMVSKWETGYQTPEMYTILCIADLFEVSIDFLNGRQGDRLSLPQEAALDDEILSRLLSLSPEELDKVDGFIQGIIASRENADENQ